MYRKSFEEDPDNIKAILDRYELYKNGFQTVLLDEDEFETLINYFDDLEQLHNAIEASEIGSASFPYSAFLKIKKADLYIAAKQYKKALHILNQAEILDATDYNISILRIDAHLALGEKEKAYEYLHEGFEKFTGFEKIEYLFECADVFDDYEDFEYIFECLEKILEEDPNNEEALHKICFWADHLGKSEKSVQIHINIIDQYPYNELAWFNLGCAYQNLKLYEKAIDAYKYAVVIDEKFDLAYRNIADAWMRLRKYHEAVEALQEVLQMVTPDEVLCEALGFCYEKLGVFDKARRYYKKAIEMVPFDTKLIYKIACTYISEEKWDQAIKYLEQSTTFYSNKAEYQHALGVCYFNKHDVHKAIECFTDAVAIKPKWKIAWKDLLNCFMDLGEMEMIPEIVDEANKNTNNKEPLFNFYKMASLYLMGKRKESLVLLENILPKQEKHFRKIIEIVPELLSDKDVIHLISMQKNAKRTQRNNKNNNLD
jgi:tetratricopeptide (TPR) repeat protein